MEIAYHEEYIQAIFKGKRMCTSWMYTQDGRSLRMNYEIETKEFHRFIYARSSLLCNKFFYWKIIFNRNDFQQKFFFLTLTMHTFSVARHNKNIVCFVKSREASHNVCTLRCNTHTIARGKCEKKSSKTVHSVNFTPICVKHTALFEFFLNSENKKPCVHYITWFKRLKKHQFWNFMWFCKANYVCSVPLLSCSLFTNTIELSQYHSIV